MCFCNFDTTKLPDKVNIGWTSCPVRVYIPRPRRCYKCQKFGHGSTTCRSRIDICGKCGKVAHHGDCTEEACCVNCGGPHPSFIRACPTYKREQEIIANKVKNNIPYNEAKIEVNRYFVRPNATYSQATSNYEQRPTARTDMKEICQQAQANPIDTQPTSSRLKKQDLSMEKSTTQKKNDINNNESNHDKNKETEKSGQSANTNYLDIPLPSSILIGQPPLNNQALKEKGSKNNRSSNKENKEAPTTGSQTDQLNLEERKKQSPNQKEKVKRQREESNISPQSSSNEEQKDKRKDYAIKMKIPKELPTKKTKKDSSSHTGKRH